MNAYSSEQALVSELLQSLSNSSPWGEMAVAKEFFYQRGRTDVVAVDEAGRVIAFEAKLSRWRTALQQAYRNTCFAHRSYVVLPKGVALRASRYSATFGDRGVGICYIEGGRLVVIQDSEEVRPLQPWLAAMARRHAGCEPEDDVIT